MPLQQLVQYFNDRFEAEYHFYALHHTQLLDGLNNYRQRGYQIALNILSLIHISEPTRPY